MKVKKKELKTLRKRKWYVLRIVNRDINLFSFSFFILPNLLKITFYNFWTKLEIKMKKKKKKKDSGTCSGS